MIKIKYARDVKAVPLPLSICTKTANKHLGILQKEAKRDNAFYIVTISNDLFDKSMPVIYFANEINKHDSGELRDLFLKRIAKGSYPNLMFILSTNDPQKIMRRIPETWKIAPPANVMFELRIADQVQADLLIPQFTKIKGNKVISLEFQSSDISLLNWLQKGGIDWVKQTTYSIDSIETSWVHKINQECKATNTPHYFQVLSERWRIPADLKIEQHPDGIFDAAYQSCNTPPKAKREVRGFTF